MEESDSLWSLKPGVTLSNITLPNNSLYNSYFENPIVELHILYVVNILANFMLIRCYLLFDP